ncbi:MAG TPA: hypothetical protein VLK33_11950, partial [Terriglobales bacterium]|nr:hypothetical protein [Terriglobales bacterium]
AVYEGLNWPKEANLATGYDWTAHFDRLKKWQEAYPESITPRVALANAYIEYGLDARGTGYANTVSRENIRLYKERTALAKAELERSEALNKKCPEWYSAKLSVAHSDGVSFDEYNAIFEEAVAYEPLYFYNYRAKALYLLPQWYGRPGEWQKFAADASDKIGGREGSAMYYYIAANTMFTTDSYESLRNGSISWEKIEQGYKDMEAMYGPSEARLNEIAKLGMHASDIPASCGYMQKIGNNLNESVWKKETFEGYRKFCESVKGGDPRIQIAKEKMPPQTEQHP